MPQPVPSGALAVVSLHTSIPPVQADVPLWHGLLGVQGAPAVHDWHTPLVQYMFVPHGKPFAWLPCAVHCGPIPQEICIFWHEPASLQSTPAVHATQLPPEQTEPASLHCVPSRKGPVAEQPWMPPLHVVAPI
jgi:hypothetical protein